jgi:predicted aspartyl protease
MRSLALALMLALGLSAAAKAADPQDCSLKLFVSLDTGSVPDRLVVPVSIGGKTYHFLVDTGGIYSFIDQGVADSLGLTPHSLNGVVELYSSMGNSPQQYVDALNVEIGPIHLDHFAMILGKRDPGDTVIDGILAPDFLSKFDLEFDPVHHKLNLFSQEHCAGKVIYWSNAFAQVDFKFFHSHAVFSMTLDGHDVETILDTGSSETFLSEKISNRVFDIDQKSPGVEPAPDELKDVAPYRYHFKSISVGGLAVNNPLIYILPDRMEKAFHKNHNDKSDTDPVYGVSLDAPELILGSDVLNKLRIFLSYKEHKLYFTSADAH